MQIITKPITIAELQDLAARDFGDFVKAVVDIEKVLIVVGGQLHADQEAVLLEHGSKQEHLWGINLYPEKSGDAMVEFDSMINIRPRQGNRSREVEDPKTRERIIMVVKKWIA